MSRLPDDNNGSLTWLHISDLHFAPENDFERDTVLDGLARHVKQLRDDESWVPDLVFVTGDIANRGADKEYERASEFFDKLLAATGCPKSHLFVVPGNHDVDRSQSAFLQRTLALEAESDAFFAEPGEPRRKEEHQKRVEGRHLSKLRAFREWYGRYFGAAHTIDPFSLCAAPQVVEVRGSRVAVLPISTAIFCADDSDHNKLWVGRSWLHRAIVDIGKTESDLRVALMHHPLDWLHNEERAQINSELSKSVDVVLRGHLHDTEAEASASARARVVHLAAGASYQHPSWPKRALYARADLAQGILRVHPIRYEKDPHREWTLDTSVFLNAPSFEAEFPIPRLASQSTGRSARASSPAAAALGTR